MRLLDKDGKKLLDSDGKSFQTNDCNTCCDCYPYSFSVSGDLGYAPLCPFGGPFSFSVGPNRWNPKIMLQTWSLYDYFPNALFPDGVHCGTCADPRLYGSVTLGPVLDADGNPVDCNIWALTLIYADDAIAFNGVGQTACQSANYKFSAGEKILTLAAGDTFTVEIWENYGILTTAYGILGAALVTDEITCP